MMDLHKRIPEMGHLVIVSALTLYAFIMGLTDLGRIFQNLNTYLPILGLAAITIWAMLKGKVLVSYFLLLFVFYSNGISSFFNWLIGIFNNGPQFRGEMLIDFIISVFVLGMVVLFAMDKPKTNKNTDNMIVLLLLIYAAFNLVLYGVISAVYVIFVPVLILMFGSPMLALAYVIASHIGAPFGLIDVIILGNLTFSITVRYLLIFGVLTVFIWYFVKLAQKYGFMKD